MMFAPINTRRTYRINHDDCAFLRRRPAPVPVVADDDDAEWRANSVLAAVLLMLPVALRWVGYAVLAGAATWAVCWMFGIGL